MTTSDAPIKRHFWRYIDARTHEVLDNRFQIAQMIACQPDEPRYIGDQDVFVLQEKVVDAILKAERETEAKAAAPKTVDPTQQAVVEELKHAIRRGTVNRDSAKAAIRYLSQPMARFAVKRLRSAHAEWRSEQDDQALLAAVEALAADFAKDSAESESPDLTLARAQLDLVCFEYVSS